MEAKQKKLFCGQVNKNEKLFPFLFFDYKYSCTKDKRVGSVALLVHSSACLADGMGLHLCLWPRELTYLETRNQFRNLDRHSRKTEAPSQGGPYFSKTMPNLTLPPFQQHGF